MSSLMVMIVQILIGSIYLQLSEGKGSDESIFFSRNNSEIGVRNVVRDAGYRGETRRTREGGSDLEFKDARGVRRATQQSLV